MCNFAGDSAATVPPATTGWSIDSVQVSSTSYNCASIDSDNDGIPDGWESLYGLNPNDSADAGEDFDGDGLTNLQEYIAGTDPNSAASIFQITSFSHDENAGSATLTFSSVNGRLYRIEYNDDLANANGWTTLQDNVVGTGGNIPINDPAAGMTKRFYRIVAKL